jgi:hypothetical protein
MIALSISYMTFASLGHGTQGTNEALFHSGHALRLLNQKLGSSTDELSEPIFAVVISLAMSEVSTGNLAQATAHLNGLQRMLEIKGGFSYLNGNRFLQQKMLRRVYYLCQARFAFLTSKGPTSTTAYGQGHPLGLVLKYPGHRQSCLRSSTCLVMVTLWHISPPLTHGGFH